MRRKGIYKPTIEDAIEIGGIETLHPGGFALTRRAAELAGLKKDQHVLDVSSGRGTQSIFYSREYDVQVTGVDLSEDMIKAARQSASQNGISDRVCFVTGDSQKLPFADNSFDAVINECAVGIPDDSQQVLNEMVRVAKPGGRIVIHESTWRREITDDEKEELSERYGTTPLDLHEWIDMLKGAGVQDIDYEFDEWSKPEFFWKIRKDRDVKHRFFTLTPIEKIKTFYRICHNYGYTGVFNILKNERIFYRAILSGKLGYAIFAGTK